MTTTHEMMVMKNVVVQPAEMVDSCCRVPLKEVAEMLALMPNQ
jgi:hypothetical protein